MPNPKGHEDSIKDSRFKAAWQSGPTRTIRVPITLAENILEYARKLDSNPTESRDTMEKINGETVGSSLEPRDTMEEARINGETVGSSLEPRDTMEEANNQTTAIRTESRDTTLLCDQTSELQTKVDVLEQQLAEALKQNEALRVEVQQNIRDKAWAIKNLFPTTKKVTVKQIEAILKG
jgi:hypothetical protein